MSQFETDKQKEILDRVDQDSDKIDEMDLKKQAASFLLEFDSSDFNPVIQKPKMGNKNRFRRKKIPNVQDVPKEQTSQPDLSSTLNMDDQFIIQSPDKQQNESIHDTPSNQINKQVKLDKNIDYETEDDQIDEVNDDSSAVPIDFKLEEEQLNLPYPYMSKGCGVRVLDGYFDPSSLELYGSKMIPSARYLAPFLVLPSEKES
ncbi:MAG: hypothetical protein EZS28_043245, partial [Streblomastix strix]